MTIAMVVVAASNDSSGNAAAVTVAAILFLGVLTGVCFFVLRQLQRSGNARRELERVAETARAESADARLRDRMASVEARLQELSERAHGTATEVEDVPDRTITAVPAPPDPEPPRPPVA